MRRHLLLITGAPAAGKSTLARALSDSLEIPCLSKDAIKESLFDSLGVGDVEWSQRLGRAAIEILVAITAELPTAIVDCNFDLAFADRFVRPDVIVVEVFCRVPPEVATRRFADRTRHEGHRDAERLADVATWIASAEPLALGPLLEVDTSSALDVPRIAQWVRDAFLGDGEQVSADGTPNGDPRW